MQVVVDSLLTNYQRFGNGDAKAVVILHGWADNSMNWLEFARRLSDSYHVVVLDLPGFGKTDTPRQTWGLDDYAIFVSHFLRKINCQPYAVVGHSNGGAIAVRGLATGNLQAERLVLLASAGVRTTGSGRKRLLRIIAKTGKVLTLPLPATVRTRLRRKLYAGAGSDMLIAEHMQETFKRVVGQDVQTDAAQISMPTLLVYGERDTATPPAYGRLLHEQINGSTLQVIGAAGHFLQHDQPDQIIALTKEFLA